MPDSVSMLLKILWHFEWYEIWVGGKSCLLKLVLQSLSGNLEGWHSTLGSGYSDEVSKGDGKGKKHPKKPG